MLAAAGNGVRVTGIVLAAEIPREFKGTSGKGNPYSFSVRELQIFTGNKVTICKHQMDIGSKFPDVVVGSVMTFKVKSVRMNGTVPVFELENEQ